MIRKVDFVRLAVLPQIRS